MGNDLTVDTGLIPSLIATLSAATTQPQSMVIRSFLAEAFFLCHYHHRYKVFVSVFIRSAFCGWSACATEVRFFTYII